MKSLIVSLHDVAPATIDASRSWMNLLNERNLSVSMLVVPGPWRGGDLIGDDSFRNWLNETATDQHEVVQHGFSHTIDHFDESGIFSRLVGNFAAHGTNRGSRCQLTWGDEQPRIHRITIAFIHFSFNLRINCRYLR